MSETPATEGTRVDEQCAYLVFLLLTLMSPRAQRAICIVLQENRL